MNVYMRRLYVDELLYSLCISYINECAYAYPGTIIREMFGAPLALSPYLPSKLEYFAERTKLSIGLTKEELWTSHTMYPFLCFYMPEWKVLQIAEAAFSGRIVGTTVTGLRFVSPPHLRWCPDCVKRDRATYGETYWHRVHQLPGLWRCDKHGLELVDSIVPRFAESRRRRGPAELLIPEDVASYRHVSSASAPEIFLGRRMIGLLTQHHPDATVDFPALSAAAVQAGFSGPRGVDFRGVYENFLDFWGCVLGRVNLPNNYGVLGQGWLRAQFGKRRAMWSPLVRNLFYVFFFMGHGVNLDEIEQYEVPANTQRKVFYCPNPYAHHGKGKQVENVDVPFLDSGLVRLRCECGLYVTVPATLEGYHFSMEKVVRVTRYGDSWRRRVESFRKKGYETKEIAKRLGIHSSVVRIWIRNAIARPPSKCIINSRREWMKLLDAVSPGRIKEALSRNPQLYQRLCVYDSVWLKDACDKYRKRHNHSKGRVTDWARKDLECASRILQAASRLEEMNNGKPPSMSALFREAGLSRKVVTDPRRVPNVASIVQRLTRRP